MKICIVVYNLSSIKGMLWGLAVISSIDGYENMPSSDNVSNFEYFKLFVFIGYLVCCIKKLVKGI